MTILAELLVNDQGQDIAEPRTVSTAALAGPVRITRSPSS